MVGGHQHVMCKVPGPFTGTGGGATLWACASASSFYHKHINLPDAVPSGVINFGSGPPFKFTCDGVQDDVSLTNFLILFAMFLQQLSSKVLSSSAAPHHHQQGARIPCEIPLHGSVALSADRIALPHHATSHIRTCDFDKYLN